MVLGAASLVVCVAVKAEAQGHARFFGYETEPVPLCLMISTPRYFCHQASQHPRLQNGSAFWCARYIADWSKRLACLHHAQRSAWSRTRGSPTAKVPGLGWVGGLEPAAVLQVDRLAAASAGPGLV